MAFAFTAFRDNQKNLNSEEGDTRSGMFNSLAEWSAKVVNKLPEANERAWQPNLLVPAQSINDVVRSYKTIYSLARPKGSVKILGFDCAGEQKKLAKRLPEICEYFVEQGISAGSAPVHADSFVEGFLTSMQSLKASFFTPNTLFLSLTDNNKSDKDITSILSKAKAYGFGAYLYVPFRKVGLGLEKTINLWIDLRAIELELKYRVEGFNIGLLTAYLLKKNWNAKLNIIVIIKECKNVRGKKHSAKKYMEKLMTLARMPKDTHVCYVKDDINKVVDDVPRADLNILCLQSGDIQLSEIREQTEIFETSILYTLDSGVENAFA